MLRAWHIPGYLGIQARNLDFSCPKTCRSRPADENKLLQEANEDTVAPAEEVVAGDLLPEESVQLTDAILANLTDLALTDIDLFTFGSGDDASEVATASSKNKRATPKCKTFPGDALWPHPITWTVLDLLTGGRVIKSVPIGASCYDDFGVYNAAKCASITDNWTNSYLQ